MASGITLPTTASPLITNAPTIATNHSYFTSARFPFLGHGELIASSLGCLATKGNRGGPARAVSLAGVEPDLPETDEDDTRTAGWDQMDTFEYGKADGHHTFHKEDADIDAWEAFKEVFVEAGGPTEGFQFFLAWGTLPIVYGMIAYGVKVEYVFLIMVLYIFSYIGIEMAKPEQDHEFPPEVYKERRRQRAAAEAAEEKIVPSQQ